MGRFLVILLILLVPLRGWSAERMAVHMTQGQLAVEAAGGQVSTVTMPADCPMLVQQTSKTDDSSSSGTHSTCLTCQLCMFLATQDSCAPNVLAFQRLAPPASIAISFISAELMRQAKPPIS